MRIGWLIFAIIAALILLQVSDSSWFKEQPTDEKMQQTQEPVTFIVGDGVPLPDETTDYEVVTGQNERAWLASSQERRSQLNEIRYNETWEDDQELREDRKLSRNWKVTIDGETYLGYDVIRDIEGEFTDFPETERSDVYYQQIVRYGYS